MTHRDDVVLIPVASGILLPEVVPEPAHHQAPTREDAGEAGSKEIEMSERRQIAPTEDPVCGMIVRPDEARAKGLTETFDGTEYAFCGKGCLLEFRDAPETYLDPGYSPTM
jgi:YHS domain-containing protein